MVNDDDTIPTTTASPSLPPPATTTASVGLSPPVTTTASLSLPTHPASYDNDDEDDNVSVASSSSNASWTSTKGMYAAAKARAKKAALIAKAKALDEEMTIKEEQQRLAAEKLQLEQRLAAEKLQVEQRLEAEKQRLEAKAKKHEVLTEIKMAEASEQVFSELEGSSNMFKSLFDKPVFSTPYSHSSEVTVIPTVSTVSTAPVPATNIGLASAVFTTSPSMPALSPVCTATTVTHLPTTMNPAASVFVPSAMAPGSQPQPVPQLHTTSHAAPTLVSAALHQPVSSIVPTSHAHSVGGTVTRPTPVPSPANHSMVQQYVEADMNAFQALAAAVSLPQPEVPKFDGDPTEYHDFIMAFDARIVPRAASDSDRLYYLRQHLLGDAKDIISACPFMVPEVGYATARSLLSKEFGDPYKVSTGYVKKLLEWTVIRPDDPRALKKLSCFLLKCKYAMFGLHHMQVLNHATNLRAITDKLPTYMQNQWRKKVSKLRSESRDVEHLFSELVDFVQKSSDAENDPVFGREAPSNKSSQQKVQQQPQQQRTLRSSSYLTDASHVYCALCKKSSHNLEDCSAFKRKNLDERNAFLESQRMCFGCFGYNHFSRGCSNKMKCDICKARHPTLLHDDDFHMKHRSTWNRRGRGPSTPRNDGSTKHAPEKSPPHNDGSTKRAPEKPPETSSFAVDNGSSVFHAILPVKIRQKGSDCIVSTYAFFDNGSAGCFITDDVLSQLSATTNPVTMQLKTMHGSSTSQSATVHDLVVTDFNDENPVSLPKTYATPDIPVGHHHIPRPELLTQWSHLREVSEWLPHYMPQLPIGLLVGSNCPVGIEPLKVVPSQRSGPFAVLLRHGWTVYGPVSDANVNNETSCSCIVVKESVKDIVSPEAILNMFDRDFSDQSAAADDSALSFEDTRFLEIVGEKTLFKDGHYEIPLPFRDEGVKMPNNRAQAFSRLQWQRKKMENQEYHQHYTKFIDDMLTKGYAVKVPDDKIETEVGRCWYLPHHGVYHPRKPGKIRVVFDCSATYKGESLNSHLLQGPDLTNSIIGVLTRFREKPIAFNGDIESMFHQVKVFPEHRDFLRFLWWPDGDTAAKCQEYQMTVHIFGATSSPSVCNYALRRIAEDDDLDKEVCDTIQRNFYVDDCLRSTETAEEAIDLVKNLRSACSDGGFRLTKFMSNSRQVLESIPSTELAKDVQALDITTDALPNERVLGVQWCISSDVFQFCISLTSKPPTRRGILSMVSAIYDPLGFVAPFILPAKRILQQLCKENLGWDEEIPDELDAQWSKWLAELPMLEQLVVNRCLKPVDFGSVTERQLHIFSDASFMGYASCAFLRLRNDEGRIHCSFVMGKARVAPLKSTTIPRLELSAAMVSARLGKMITRELEASVNVIYHTDSTAVLHFISNDKKRLPIFVANRVRQIRDISEKHQWRFVETTENPADQGSRGLSGKKMSENSSWLNGPEFLWRDEHEWKSQPPPQTFDDVTVDNATQSAAVEVDDCSSFNTVKSLIAHYSDWFAMKKAFAVYLRVFRLLKERCQSKQSKTTHSESWMAETFSVGELNRAEVAILKFTQQEYFKKDVDDLQDKKNVSRSSSLSGLNPFLQDGLLRVGGRLSRATICYDMKHPVILPKRSHVTTVVIRHVHERLAHSGRNHVISTVREKYWVIAANAAVRRVISDCVPCRSSRGPLNQQQMADLPSARTSTEPPFTYTGVDLFGPMTVKEGRKVMKRYGVIFTCLSCRAIHIETVSSLETDTFLNALRRFIARRGNVRQLISDNGTNFVGANRELKNAAKEIDQSRVSQFLLRNNIDWAFNPPAASHFGGVWERQIRTIRKVLSSLLHDVGDRLDDESLRTLLCETEAIVNSRPLTVVSGDVNDLTALSPASILTLRSEVILPPPGEFQRDDVYMRKRWRRVQHLANAFWTRWRKEYLLTLQQRQKWQRRSRNVSVGDVVIIKDDLPRNQWLMGRVIATKPDAKGLVRSVEIKTKNGSLTRPIHKTVTLIASHCQ